MDNVIVFTGWGNLDYACAAAVVSRLHPEARVEAVSQRRLTRRIEWLVANEQMPEKLYILGVPVKGWNDGVRGAFSSLREEGCELYWVSAIPGVGSRLSPLGF